MQQAVIVYLPLSDGGFGTADERAGLLHLEDQLEEAVEKSGAGEFDGDMFGEGECIFYMYGPDADCLYAVVEPLLRACPRASGGYAVKEYGEATDLEVPKQRVSWQ